MRKKVLLLQPRCGKYDLYICDLPLSLIYLSSVFHASDRYQSVIIDQRVEPDWRTRVLQELESDVILVGITTMTGEPIRHALEMASFVREHADVPMVWGGIHPTIMPRQTLENDLVDFVIVDKGEYSIYRLLKHLDGEIPIDQVPGLYFKKEGKIYNNPVSEHFDWDGLPIAPYDLVDHSKYYRSGFDKKLISIMTSRNCPHKCSFCYNSSLSGFIKWMPDSIDRTKRTLDELVEKYSPTYISFIDDDFFANPRRAATILEYLREKKWNVNLGFRGARVDDLLCLDDSMFELLDAVNTRHINIGVESGSPAILKRLVKRITPDMIIELNRRFLKYPKMIPLYNFFSGIPEETENDIRLSTQLILKLTSENPNCQISGFHQYTPYPGSALYEEAKRYGFVEPQKLGDWAEMQLENNARNCPWLDRKRIKLLNMIYTAIYFIDNKYETYFLNGSLIHRFLYPFVYVYKKIARMRLRYHITFFPLEVFGNDLFYFIADKLGKENDRKSSNKEFAECPLCGSKELKKLFTKLSYSYFSCLSCSHEFIAPFPSKKHLASIYSEKYYLPWSKGGNSGDLDIQKEDTFEGYLKIIGKYSGKGRLLDVGCALGQMLGVATRLGFETYGIDCNVTAVNSCENRGYKVYLGDLETAGFESEYFDVIVMLDLLEHIVGPKAFMNEISRILKKEGIIFIATPNIDSISRRVLRGQWPHYKTEHLHYFSKQSIKMLLESHFQILEHGRAVKSLSLGYVGGVLREYSQSIIMRTIGRILIHMGYIFKGVHFKIGFGEMFLIAQKNIKSRK
ncbi:MAG: methyltransferase domain-containing protein [Oligoflexales bacterium]|nr:methyltransferase domain-containing protein [Oligoflexales bacterium]